MRKVIALAILLAMLPPILTGCRAVPPKYNKYSDTFFGTFDAPVQLIAYTKSEQEFNSYFAAAGARFQELHRLYDIYNNYPGLNNIKTINDNAGEKPVKVDKEIIDLVLFAKEWYAKVGGTNIALGPVLKIWHDYRLAGNDDPTEAKLPPMADLQAAARYTDLDKVIVDPAAGTVFLAERQMRLDVGAVAKGYAAEIVARELEMMGLKSGIINAGGNVRVLGEPLDGVRKRWGVGIHNPEKSIFDEDNPYLDTIYVNQAAVVSSGDYQRYYIVDGKRMHHLIDPRTLMPANHYRMVTVVTADSGVADFLSTAAFVLPYEESRVLIQGLDGVEALWVTSDGQVEATDGMKKIMRSQGASGATAQ
ncbi:MAG: FAD:protein FMN transferase [bacterium]